MRMLSNSGIRISILGALPWTYIRQQHIIGISPARSITFVKSGGGSGGLTKGDYRDVGGGLCNFQDYCLSGQFNRTDPTSIRCASGCATPFLAPIQNGGNDHLTWPNNVEDGFNRRWGFYNDSGRTVFNTLPKKDGYSLFRFTAKFLLELWRGYNPTASRFLITMERFMVVSTHWGPFRVQLELKGETQNVTLLGDSSQTFSATCTSHSDYTQISCLYGMPILFSLGLRKRENIWVTRKASVEWQASGNLCHHWDDGGWTVSHMGGNYVLQGVSNSHTHEYLRQKMRVSYGIAYFLVWGYASSGAHIKGAAFCLFWLFWLFNMCRKSNVFMKNADHPWMFRCIQCSLIEELQMTRGGTYHGRRWSPKLFGLLDERKPHYYNSLNPSHYLSQFLFVFFLNQQLALLFGREASTR